MDDEYYEYELEDGESEEAETAHDDVEEAFEDKTLLHRTLVHLVQQDPPLYNNKIKEYCGKRFNQLQGYAPCDNCIHTKYIEYVKQHKSNVPLDV